MPVWQVRAVLCLGAFTGSCDRSPDHTTTWSTSLLRQLLLAVRDRIIRAQHSPEPTGNSYNGSTYMQKACLPPDDYKTTLPPSSSSSRQHHECACGRPALCYRYFPLSEPVQ